MKLLLVEDDPGLGRIVSRSLVEAGYSVDTAEDGCDGLELALGGRYGVIVLDVLLPGVDGLEISRRLRAGAVSTPILMLTVRDAIRDRVAGLDAGADDYLTKPFALAELLARIRALSRRGPEAAPIEYLSVGDLTIDVARHEVRRGGRAIELTAREFALLEYLVRNAGRVLTKDQIMDQIWGYDSDVSSNVVEIYIHYLRNRVDRGFALPLIRTVRRFGYAVKA